VTAVIASIPSPPSGELELFGLSIHMYGLMIALGVVAGVWLAGRRMESAGVGTRDDMSSIGMWAVFAGIIEARLYYVATDKSQPWKEPGKWLKVWEGGLGIPGGLLAGVLVAVWAIKRRGLPVGAVLNAAVPGVPLAQAIGRLGNWWNQELFGRPTVRPWALEVSDRTAERAGYPPGTTFHPTFLYEMVWNLALCVLLILIGRRFALRGGRLLVIYVLGYSIGRFFVEGLRIDDANMGGGLRLNQWTALVAGVLAAGYLLIDWWRHRGDAPLPIAEPAVSDDPQVADYVPGDD
jgi:prolipoprotein diacylglyceryl transferase